MNLIRRLLRQKPAKHNPQDDLPPLYGGDGSSPEKAVVVNCCSVESKDLLIDSFLEEKHGTKGIIWQRQFEWFVNDDGIPEDSIRAVEVTFSDNSTRIYYFDISRPMNVAMKLAEPWLRQLQEKSLKLREEPIPKSVMAHFLDPNQGHIRQELKVGDQVDEETVKKFADNGNIYVVVAYENGVPQHVICKKDMWDEMKKMFDQIDEQAKRGRLP